MTKLEMALDRVKALEDVIRGMQWVMPVHNGNYSCASCGAMRHHGCYEGCEAAAVTGDSGKPE